MPNKSISAPSGNKPLDKKSLTNKLFNLFFWLIIFLFVVLLSVTLIAYQSYQTGSVAFPYTLKSPEEVRSKSIKEGYKLYTQKYPDYINAKTNKIISYLYYIPVSYSYYSFEYPSDWELNDFDTFQTVRPGVNSVYYTPKGKGSSQISVRKDPYIETHEVWLQNTDNRIKKEVKFRNFSGVHETADDRQNWSLYFKNRKDYEYHFNLSPRTPIGDKVLQDMVDSFEVHETKIKVPWMVYVLAIGYLFLSIIDIIIPIL